MDLVTILARGPAWVAAPSRDIQLRLSQLELWGSFDTTLLPHVDEWGKQSLHGAQKGKLPWVDAEARSGGRGGMDRV